MTQLTLDISMSLDGFVAGPNITMEQPLGEGGELLHDWITRLASWRARHGREGGETGPANDLVEEAARSIGAYIMGRRMFSGGAGPWADDPNADGWWGEEPPFRAPVYVLTHHEREPLVKQGTTFTFVTEGIESALEQAKAAAGERDVQLSGGADVVQQYLRAGLVDALQIHVAPVLLGGGTSLFGELGASVALQPADATHLTLTPTR
jgi:dihydrofolate reductase